MNDQLIYVIVALLLAICYVIYRVRKVFAETKNGCYGCKGCAIRDQILKKMEEKGEKNKKPSCFKKKL